METNALLIASCFFVCILTSVLAAHFGYFASAQKIEERLTQLSVRSRLDADHIDRMGLRLVR